MNDLSNPLSPLNPLNPFNPLSPLWVGRTGQALAQTAQEPPKPATREEIFFNGFMLGVMLTLLFVGLWWLLRNVIFQRKDRDDPLEQNLDFTGNGRISVPVADILNSPKTQEQVAAVRRIAAAERARR